MNTVDTFSEPTSATTEELANAPIVSEEVPISPNESLDANIVSESLQSTPPPPAAATISPTQKYINRLVDMNAASPIRLYILTPCYGGVVHVSYMASMSQTQDLFKKMGIEIMFVFCSSESLIQRGRNNLIAKAMFDQSMTHAMFIDADIEWKAIDIVKLLVANKPLMSGIYPIKKYYWDRLLEPNVISKWLETKRNTPALAQCSDVEMIQACLLRYNKNDLPTNGSMNIVDNIIEYKHVATGFFMMSRKMLIDLMNLYPELKYVDDTGFLTEAESKYCYSLFDCSIENGHYLSEDWGFCKKWAQSGGKTFADISVNLKHTGNESFVGNQILQLLGNGLIKL